MKIQPMASALRVSLTLRETRALFDLANAGVLALGSHAPGGAAELIEKLRIGADDLAAKQAESRARKASKWARPVSRPHMNITIEGLTISASLGDWIDIGDGMEVSVWGDLTPERENRQAETRYNAWRVLVLNPSPYGPPWLVYGCTLTEDRAEVETLARSLIATIDPEHLAAVDDQR